MWKLWNFTATVFWLEFRKLLLKLYCLWIDLTKKMPGSEFLVLPYCYFAKIAKRYCIVNFLKKFRWITLTNKIWKWRRPPLMKCYTNFKKHHSTIQKKSTLVRLQEIFLRLYTCAKCSRWVRFFTNFNIFLKRKKKKKSTHFSSKYQKCFNFGNIRKAELKTWTISLCKYIFFWEKN